MTIAAVLALAVLDSVNPSAIVVTLYLLSTAHSRAHLQVGVYIAAIFVTYFALGATLLLGLDALVPSLGDLFNSRTGFVIQSLVGLALLIYSLTASTGRATTAGAPRPSAGTYVAVAMLGVTVTAMELPTAIPYIAAVAVMTEAALPVQRWVPLLAVYNLIFVLPPMALLVGHVALGQRMASRYEALRQRLQRGAQETALWVAGLVGGGLLITGIIELLARLR